MPEGGSRPTRRCQAYRQAEPLSPRKAVGLSSDVPTYPSRFTRACNRSMIRSVVSTPTSEVTKISSSSSRKSSSIFFLLTIALAILEKTPCLVRSSPLSSVSFLLFFENKSKKSHFVSSVIIISKITKKFALRPQTFDFCFEMISLRHHIRAIQADIMT